MLITLVITSVACVAALTNKLYFIKTLGFETTRSVILHYIHLCCLDQLISVSIEVELRKLREILTLKKDNS